MAEFDAQDLRIKLLHGGGGKRKKGDAGRREKRQRTAKRPYD
jgi:hypothetical protein